MASLAGLEGRAANALTHLGERLSADWLIYNPLRMRDYHRIAMSDAATVAGALVAAFPGARSAVDVGCGTGALAAALGQRGLNVQACERSRVGRRIGRSLGVQATSFDLAREPPAAISGPVDVAYSVEVAEHLPKQLGDRLVAFLCALAPIVVFTAAAPGQGGDGHINEQPRGYWVERFARYRYEIDQDATDHIALELARGAAASWLVNNIAVFRAAGGLAVAGAGVPDSAS